MSTFFYKVTVIEGRRFQIDLSRGVDMSLTYASLIWRVKDKGLTLDVEASAETTTRLAQVAELADEIFHDVGNDLEKIVEKVKATGWGVYWHQPLKCWRKTVDFAEHLQAWRYVNEEGEEFLLLAEDVMAATLEVVKLAAADDDLQTLREMLGGQAPEMIEWHWQPRAISDLYQDFIEELDIVPE